jgi:GTP-binding protein HflX
VSPIQQRNLEKAWACKVLDRTGLILEIFGARARTREGRMQVELAHLTYQKSRLVRTWTHLERQRGGFGFLGGPGEAQIETDRRLIEERIESIKRDLAGVVKTRALHRAGRKRVPFPVVAIVGYTNAGKSTLFNRLTGASVVARDQVFETLDPTMREVKLDSGRRIILSDTVGFISDLPTTLVAAFRATLEEVVEADLILHVRDISHPETEAQRRDVEAVLASLEIDAAAAEAPLLEVWNKADRLGAAERSEAERAAARSDRPPVLISALTGEGIETLRAAIDARLGARDEVLVLEIPAREGRLLSWLHANTQVLAQETAESGATTARIRIDPDIRGKLDGQLKRAGLVSTRRPSPRT